VHVIVENGRTRIVLSGEIDADLAADLADATADAEAAALPIDIDAQHVTFMDSSGIAFLARVATRVQQPVRVLRAPESVRFLLQVTRIHELLEVVPGGPSDDEPDDVEPVVGDLTDVDELPSIGPRGRNRPEPPDVIA
jgi:anti-sigma B factor antagonist